MYSLNALDPAPAEVIPDHGGADPDAAAKDSSRLIIDSRFGSLAISRNSILDFPRGLLGFSEFHSFGIADLSDPRYAQFKVLQCLDDHQLAFLVLPLDPNTGFIDHADIETACDSLLVKIDDLVILLVVTVRKVDTGASVTANLRAPLLIDSTSRIGNQYVMRNERYPVRFQI